MTRSPKQLKSTTVGLMVSTALFFDAFQALVQLIWVLGQILAVYVAVFAFLTFWLWFKLYGVKFSTPKRSVIMGGGFLIELIPILNVLPAWTLAVTLIITNLKLEALKINPSNDVEKNKEA